MVVHNIIYINEFVPTITARYVPCVITMPVGKRTGSEVCVIFPICRPTPSPLFLS
jgi:hypothetical protein